MNEVDLIIGPHSINEALNNSQRKIIKLAGTQEGLSKINIKDCKVLETVKNQDQLLKMAQPFLKKNNHNMERIPGAAFLLAEPLPEYNLSWLYSQLDQKENFRLLILDRVTDVHNGAAILRTAAFFNFDAVLVSVKGGFGLTPSFFRTASGAVEHLPMVQCAALSKAINALKQRDVEVIGLSEHAESEFSKAQLVKPQFALVFGTEETGLSHAVVRSCSLLVKLPAEGKIKSLNVSVAAAISMKIATEN